MENSGHTLSQNSYSHSLIILLDTYIYSHVGVQTHIEILSCDYWCYVL